MQIHGVKVPDFMCHMPMLHSSRTFSLARPIVERHEETSDRFPKLVRASAATRHPICLSVTSQIECDITSTISCARLTWRKMGVLCAIGMLSCWTTQTVLDLCAAIKA